MSKTTPSPTKTKAKRTIPKAAAPKPLAKVAGWLSDIEQQLPQLKDSALQAELKTAVDQALRAIFDHCQQRNRLKLSVQEAKSKIKFPAPSEQSSSVPSLADPAVRQLGSASKE